MTRSPACNMSLRSERLLIVEIIRSCVLNCQQAILRAPARALRRRMAQGLSADIYRNRINPRRDPHVANALSLSVFPNDNAV